MTNALFTDSIRTGRTVADSDASSSVPFEEIELKSIFFDLDGTLVDGAPAVVASLRSALESCEARYVSDELLRLQVGRSLPDIFEELCPAIDEDGIQRAVAVFRRKFDQCGVTLSLPYPGVTALLRKLSTVPLWVVTTKPEFYARQIVDAYFPGIFTGVVGPSLREGNSNKIPLIREALAQAGVEPSEVIMVGDRKFDIEGALALDIEPVGVLWGYGSASELKRARCRYFAQNPEELIARLAKLRHFKVAA